jgi:hypothetical protein
VIFGDNLPEPVKPENQKTLHQQLFPAGNTPFGGNLTLELVPSVWAPLESTAVGRMAFTQTEPLIWHATYSVAHANKLLL